MCQKFTSNKNEAAGKEAVSYLARSAEVSGDIAQECMLLLLQQKKDLEPVLVDRIVTGLLRECLAARALLGKHLNESAATEFERYYDLGDGSANAIAAVVLEPSAWATEATREKCEKDVFQLFLAKLLEVGHDHDGKALKGIARLLATDADRLHHYIDAETFEAILSSLDIRLAIEVRSQATLITAKYLEASQTDGQKYLLTFIEERIARQKNEDMILAFSAGAAVFPVTPSMAASFFLMDGFLPSLIPLLEKKPKSERVEQAALEMLSAACVDTACRQAIHKHCTPWLQQIMQSGKEESKNLAAVISVKIQGPGNPATNGKTEESHKGDEEEEDDFVPRLKTMMISAGPTTLQSSVEGLAYASNQPKVKEELAHDRAFLGRLFDAVKRARPGSTTAFGALTLIENITRYQPTLTEDQKRMAQLRAYANASPYSSEPSPLDSDEAVTERNYSLLNAGLVPALVGIWRTLSPACISLILKIIHSISRTKSHRSALAQQGAARLCLQAYTSISGTTTADAQSRFTASHVLARIFISTDPALIFPPSGSPPLSSTLRPLLILLSPPPATDDGAPRNFLPVFETLLALTNIVSSAPNIAPQLIRLAAPNIEELLLSNFELIRRACTQLICNLCAAPEGVALFAKDDPVAKHRLHVLIALTDSEDLDTRTAAGGALASVMGVEGGVKNLLTREGGMKRVVEMVGDEDEGLRKRGVVCLGRIVCLEEGKEAVKKEGGVGKLKSLIQDAKDEDVKGMAREVVKMLEE